MPPITDPARRAETLERARTTKMARSAHAYVRGATVQFYDWLSSGDGNALPEGPAVWICGDCHIGNLGPLADADGRVDVQIRDLDQTVIGNPAHDLVRLGLSLASAARGSDLPGVTTARMMEEMARGYGLALRDPRSDEVDAADRVPEPDVVNSVRRRALGRRWRHLARERLEDVRPQIPLGSKFWALGRRGARRHRRPVPRRGRAPPGARAQRPLGRGRPGGGGRRLLDEGLQLARKAALRGAGGA